MTLAAADLGFSFGDSPVLAGVSLEIEPGQCVALIGPNGSGKTTLLRLLGGFLGPLDGAATLGGRAVSSLSAPDRARHIAFVPQSVSLAFPFSVGAFVAFGLHALGRRDASGLAQASLEQVGLASRSGDAMGELSQGQQQRASIARALCQVAGMPAGERYLLADEPLASLDPAHDLATRTLFESLSASGVGVLASLHDLAAAAAFDRVLLLGNGDTEPVWGTPEQVLCAGPLESAFGVRFESHRDASGRVVAFSPAPIG